MPSLSEINILKSKKPGYKIPEISMSQYLAENIANNDPNKIALISPDEETQLTYGELHKQVQSVASGLVQLGVTKSDLVLFFGDNSIEYAVAALATVYLGVTFSPITPANGPFEVTQQLRNSKGTVLVIDHEKVPIVERILENPDYNSVAEQLKLLIVINAKNNDISPRLMLKCTWTYEKVYNKGAGQSLQCIPYFETKPEDYFIIVYTSGTTGLPKGAIHSQYSTLAIVYASDSEIPRHSLSSLTLPHPMGHISGSIVLLTYLAQGTQIVMFRHNNLENILVAVEKYKVDMLFLTTEHVFQLAQTQFPYNLSCIKAIGTGGAMIPDLIINKLKKSLKVPILNGYGSTEFLGGVVITPGITPLGSVGAVCPNAEMKIVSLETGEALPSGQQGEICFRGPTRFVGYLGNPEETRATIDSDGWYHSGDVGYYDELGELFIVDRIKEIIKYQHWSVFPSEIEDFLHRHPAIESVCVIGVKHATYGALPRAYIVLNSTHSQTKPDEIIQYVKENLGFQRRLRGGVRFIENMPRTSIGKVDRKYFKNLVKAELITEVIE